MPPAAVEEVVGSAAQDGVVEVRSEDAVDAGEGVMADRAIAIRRAGREIDHNARRRVAELDLRGAVAGDGVVAALTLERVEPDKARGIVAVGQIAADRAVDAR